MLEHINYYFSVITKPLLFNLFLVFLVLNIFSIFRTIRLDANVLKTVTYSLLTLAVLGLFLFALDFNNHKERFFDPYGTLSWFMVLTHSFAPFLLLFKKIQDKLLTFLIVLFLMNFGRLMELFTILTIQIHRDIL